MTFADKKLKTNEQLITVVKRYWLTFFPTIILIALIIVADFFLLFPLFNWGWWGKIIFGLILLIGLILLWRLLVMLNFNLIILTAERLIVLKQKGLFDRLETEVDLDQITEVLYRVKGLPETLFKYGTLLIRTVDRPKPLYIKYIRQPHTTQQLILNTQKMNRINN